MALSITADLVNGIRLTRSMHQLQFKDEDINVLFNYGIFNKDYPNTIVWPELILDYDCYVSNNSPSNMVLSSVEKLNTTVSNLFEKSIADKLRETMEAVNE